jgi:putative endonuclease
MTLNDQNNWMVYILECCDKSLYCGITNNIERRLKQHSGELKGGAKYTLSRRPCNLVYLEKSMNRKEALIREFEIKQMSKSQKWELIET